MKKGKKKFKSERGRKHEKGRKGERHWDLKRGRADIKRKKKRLRKKREWEWDRGKERRKKRKKVVVVIYTSLWRTLLSNKSILYFRYRRIRRMHLCGYCCSILSFPCGHYYTTFHQQNFCQQLLSSPLREKLCHCWFFLELDLLFLLWETFIVSKA